MGIKALTATYLKTTIEYLKVIQVNNGTSNKQGVLNGS